ncbi:MAG: hypothetical protein GF384_02810, partial [Elusimicrobia bacterium]|nr:hypothetical protein [Elusimicrobiota bacterium]MBD3411884.1 hypothetical protein [Elusimicrobiota bacterium]
KILPYKGYIFLLFLLVLIVSGYILKTTMKFVMFPHEETREIRLTAYAPQGTLKYETARLSKNLEDILKPYIGKEVVGFRNQIARSRRGSAVEENRLRMRIEIVPKEKRKKSADKLIKEWQEKFAAVPEFSKIKLSKGYFGQDTGSPIEVIVQENNDRIRAEVATRLRDSMKQHSALANVEIEEPMRLDEYEIGIKRDKTKRLDINPTSIASTLRSILEGSILYELTDGEEEIDVRLIARDESKKDITSILSIPVENKGNYLVPLGDIVTLNKTTTPNSIERYKGKRVTKIFADLKPKTKTTPLEIAEYFEESIFPAIMSEYPSTILSFGGEIKDTRESQSDFAVAIIMVIVMIYLILVLLFNSLIKPLIIMLAIPFGIVGVIIAFWAHGITFIGFFAGIGMIGLTGVVINDSIIMLVKLDKEYERSQAKELSNQQIATIAKTRLRAVLLTTITTVSGLIPTAYGFAGYDDMLAQMMLAMTWGLIFGTLITLILIPSLYSLIRDVKYRLTG